MEKKFIHQKNKIEITFDIILKEYLNIGTGVEIDKDKTNMMILTTGMNNKFVKDSNKFGEVYIPGSSIRGVFRHKYLEIMDSLNQKEEDEYLFGIVDGNFAKKSRIIIEDAFFEKSIDLSTAKDEEKKYEEINVYTPMKNKNIPLYIQAIAPGEKLRTKLILYNTDYKEIFKIFQIFAISYIDEIRIGSNKSRGLGLVKLEIKDILLEMKDEKESLLDNNFKKFFKLNEKLSIKIANGYLKEVYSLDEKYINFDFSTNNIERLKENEFLQYIEKRGGNQ